MLLLQRAGIWNLSSAHCASQQRFLAMGLDFSPVGCISIEGQDSLWRGVAVLCLLSFLHGKFVALLYHCSCTPSFKRHMISAWIDFKMRIIFAVCLVLAVLNELKPFFMGRDFHRIFITESSSSTWIHFYGSFGRFPASRHWGFPKQKQRELVCLLTARVLFGSFAEGEEERAVETSSRSINKKEVTLPTICVPHTWPPDSHWRSSARGSGARAVLPLQSRQSRLMPYREWNARSHGAGASAQENRLLGFEFFHPFTCQATPLFHGSYSARAQAFAPGKVSCFSPEVACIHREHLEEGWKFNLLKGCCSFGALWIDCRWLSCLLGRQGLHASAHWKSFGTLCSFKEVFKSTCPWHCRALV